MKIRTSKTIQSTHKKLLQLLAVHPEIRSSIWIARAKLGITTSHLTSPQEVPNEIKEQYETLLHKDQGYKKLYELDEKHKHIDRLLKQSDAGETALRVLDDNTEFENQLKLCARDILEQHNLPSAWSFMMTTYIMNGDINLPRWSELPLALKVNRKLARNKHNEELILYSTDNFEGININISNFVYVEDLLNWIKENKTTIEKLMTALGYKKYYRPKIRENTFNEGIDLISNLQKKGKQYYREKAIKQLQEEGYEDIGKYKKDSAVSATMNDLTKKVHRFKKDYLNKLSSKSRS